MVGGACFRVRHTRLVLPHTDEAVLLRALQLVVDGAIHAEREEPRVTRDYGAATSWVAPRLLEDRPEPGRRSPSCRRVCSKFRSTHGSISWKSIFDLVRLDLARQATGALPQDIHLARHRARVVDERAPLVRQHRERRASIEQLHAEMRFEIGQR
jgi:hypothetical protein